MRKIIQLHPWPIFALLIILVFAPNFFSTPEVKKVCGFIFVLFMVTWFYSAGTNLYKKTTIKLNLSFFQINLAIIVLSLLVTYLAPLHNNNIILTSFTSILAVYAVISVMYSCYFITKLLVSIELKKAIDFKDWFPTFLMVLFLIVGIWWIQPRIKEALQ